jgi:hypothetical protein
MKRRCTFYATLAFVPRQQNGLSASRPSTRHCPSWNKRVSSSPRCGNPPWPLSKNAPFREGGKRGARPSLSKLKTWREPCAPPVFSAQSTGYTPTTLRWKNCARLLRNLWRALPKALARGRPGLAPGSRYVGRTCRPTSTADAGRSEPPPSLIPGAHQVPARAMAASIRGQERAGMKGPAFFRKAPVSQNRLQVISMGWRGQDRSGQKISSRRRIFHPPFSGCRAPYLRDAIRKSIPAAGLLFVLDDTAL